MSKLSDERNRDKVTRGHSRFEFTIIDHRRVLSVRRIDSDPFISSAADILPDSARDSVGFSRDHLLLESFGNVRLAEFQTRDCMDLVVSAISCLDAISVVRIFPPEE